MMVKHDANVTLDIEKMKREPHVKVGNSTIYTPENLYTLSFRGGAAVHFNVYISTTS